MNCIKRCKLVGNICTGCNRTIDEIKEVGRGLTLAEKVYAQYGREMRNANASERYLLSVHPNFTAFKRTTIFAFDDGSEVEIVQSAVKVEGKMTGIVYTEKFT